ncbi:hypothetical protein CapIbe_012112 [Capra ibex]
MLNKHYPPRKPVGSVCGYFSPEKFLLSRFWPDTCGKQLLTSSGYVSRICDLVYQPTPRDRVSTYYTLEVGPREIKKT